jgi:glycosyltransferase involved in cell wall biosynthesis
MSKQKLLFIAPTYNLMGGADLSFFELILGAKKRGYEMVVVVPSRGKFFDELRKNQIEVVIIKYTFWHPVFDPEVVSDINFGAIEKISSLVESNKIDLIVTNTLQIPWGALAAAYTNKPHVWIACEFPRFGSAYLQDHYDFISAFSHTVFANSELLAKHMREVCDVKNVDYFYSFVDEKKLSLNEKLTEQRIVCVSNINSNKNQLMLLKAINDLHKRKLLKNKVVLIGDYYKKDPYVQKVLKFIKDRGLENVVELTGAKENPFTYVGPNDIFVQTSLSESIGRTLIESIKLGLVCVGADIEGTKEGFELTGGVMFSKESFRDLASKLVDITNNFSKYKKHALAARDKALITQSETSSHDRFFKALEKIKVSNNPNYAVRHLRPFTSGAAQAGLKSKSFIKHQDQAIRGYQKQIDDIYNSKAWKTAQSLRKVLRRG